VTTLGIGAAGQVGRALVASAPGQVVGWARADLDLDDVAGIASRIEAVRPALVVNAAAYTAVDMAENDADAAYRIARHASSLTEGWYRAQIDAGIDPVAYVEMVGVIVAVAAVDGFFRSMGLERPALPEPDDRPGSGEHPPVEPATLNWVLVAAPADRSASVVQGLSAVPAEFENLERLAAAQYIPMFEMDRLDWNRGTLSRPEMEAVAARLSRARECFF
jgi:hypothetical protein